MNKEKKKGLNVIDIIIIVVLVLAVAAAAFIFLRPADHSGPSAQTKYIDFTIELPAINNKYKDLIKIGDPVIETVRHASIGYVVNVIYEDAIVATTNMNEGGVMIMSEYPDHQRVEITVRSPYTINENGEYSIQGTSVAVGTFLNFSTPNFITSGYCISVFPLSEQQSAAWENELKLMNKKEAENNA